MDSRNSSLFEVLNVVEEQTPEVWVLFLPKKSSYVTKDLRSTPMYQKNRLFYLFGDRVRALLTLH